METYRTVATLLTQVALPVPCNGQLSLLHLTNASVQALRHLIIGSALWFRHKEELNLELCDLIWSSSLYVGVATLALDAGRIAYLFSSPLVEACNIGNIRAPIATSLVILQADIRSTEAPIFCSKRRQKIPCRGLGRLAGLRVSLIFLSDALFFFSLPHFELLALLWGCEHTAERRRLLGFGLGR